MAVEEEVSQWLGGREGGQSRTSAQLRPHPTYKQTALSVKKRMARNRSRICKQDVGDGSKYRRYCRMEVLVDFSGSPTG